MIKIQSNNFLRLSVKTAQNYEKEAHPSLQGFWKQIPQDHPFYHNPVFKEYGHNLSQEGHNYIVKKMLDKKQKPPTNEVETINEVYKLMNKIFSIEAQHKEQLIEEAKNIVCQIWGIDKSDLNGDLTQDVSSGAEIPDNKERKEVEITNNIRSEINKRQIMNAFTQGSAVHSMQSAHYLVEEKLNKISPELKSLYTRFSELVTHHYYILDIPAVLAMMANLEKASIGWSHVEFVKEEENQPKVPKVFAQGICFPVLVQEFSKGAMEILSLNGINNNLSEEELYTVNKNADRLQDEPWLLTIGPELWRKFLKVLPEGTNLSEMVMKFSEKKPEKVLQVVRAIIQNPNAAKKYFEDLKGSI